MADLLLDINLQQQALPDEYFVGDWQVASRVLNRNAPDTPLARAQRLVMGPGQLQTHASESAHAESGHWSVMRDELLSRPYLRFDLPREQTRALVTRLRRSPDGERSQLQLYFASGMEMQLDRS
jgi:hypothetical protein